MSKRGTAVLDTPEPEYAPESSYPRRTITKPDARLRRDSVEDFADSYNDMDDERSRGGNSPRQRQPRPRTQLKLKFARHIPTSLFGRIATGVALLAIIGAVVALLMVARRFLLHDPRFMIRSPAAIEIQGNKHLTRAQLLDIFGDDVERNIFRISLDDRQAQLEALPWVQRATVMRLLPGRIRVAIVERTPIAFVRQGGRIGLVDDRGVLLDMAGAETEARYSFPVVTGVTAADPASTRTARMKIFERFTAELDGSGEKISESLSEVDLSNPEDVKALIPDHSTEVLVHFGDDHFLERYHKFQELLPQWHTQYPNLASVDMRYEREVVLDMAKPAGTKGEPGPPAKLETRAAPAITKVPVVLRTAAVHPVVDHPKAAAHALAKPAARPAMKAGAHPPAVKLKPAPQAVGIAPLVAKPQQDKPAAASNAPASAPPSTTTPSASAAARSGYPSTHVLQSPVTKPAAAKPAAAKLTPIKAAPSGYEAPKPAPAKPSSGKPSAGKPLLPAASYHPPQVATP